MDIVNRLPREYIFLNYLRCHDDIGWGLDYATLSQWGMKEVPHKQYLNDYSYREDPDKAADSRYVHRGAFQWELAKKRKEKTGVQGQLFQALQKLEKIRREESVFDADANVYTYDVHNDSILCILREKGG